MSKIFEAKVISGVHIGKSGIADISKTKETGFVKLYLSEPSCPSNYVNVLPSEIEKIDK